MARSEPKQQRGGLRMTDDSLRVRQVTHYQFSWTAREGGESGPGRCSSSWTRVPGRRS
jgi:hypothetical protein